MNQVEMLQNILATSCSSHQTGHSQDKTHAVLTSLGIYPAITNCFAYERYWQNRATVKTKMHLRSFIEAGNFNECFILLLLTEPVP